MEAAATVDDGVVVHAASSDTPMAAKTSGKRLLSMEVTLER